MADLGQQTMLEQPKARSLIVPAGCGTWWGVDASTRCCAIGVANEVELMVASDPFPKLDPLARLSVIYEGARDLAIRLVGEYGAPGVIGVEQPSGSGQQVNHELEFAVGVTIAGVYDGVNMAAVAPARMLLVVGSWWKVRSCGNGAARKTRKVAGKRNPQALPFEDYEVLRWARLNGYRGSSWDEADAMGIAAAMRSDVELVQR